jgi:CBS domain-containing protein
MLVSDILQSKGMHVETVPETTPIGEAVTILNTKRIGAVVVTAGNGAVTGILSERDVVRHLGDDPAALLKRPVTAVMTTGVVTCTRDTTIALVMERMTEFRIRHMPVVEDGKLVGILSIGDVVKWKIEEAEFEATALKEYIAT